MRARLVYGSSRVRLRSPRGGARPNNTARAGSRDPCSPRTTSSSVRASRTEPTRRLRPEVSSRSAAGRQLAGVREDGIRNRRQVHGVTDRGVHGWRLRGRRRVRHVGASIWRDRVAAHRDAVRLRCGVRHRSRGWIQRADHTTIRARNHRARWGRRERIGRARDRRRHGRDGIRTRRERGSLARPARSDHRPGGAARADQATNRCEAVHGRAWVRVACRAGDVRGCHAASPRTLATAANSMFQPGDCDGRRMNVHSHS